MDWKREKLYLVAMVQQLNWAMIAYRSLLHAARFYEVDDVMMEAHAMITHAMGGSRILWPQKGKRRSAERAAYLLQAIGIPEDHPLQATVRDARNILAHFDEDLDKFLDSHTGEQIIVQGINASPAADGVVFIQVKNHDTDQGSTGDSERLLRDFDSTSKHLTLLDKVIDLGALAAQIQEVGKAADRVLVARFLADGGPPENAGPGFPDWTVTMRFEDAGES